MILNNTPTHEAILSNVGEIGEFRIRNSAKAFSILSSGLYANKIRAIVRELSCNAVDSHVAAGRANTPFDVHLPNALEPWFAIRDYGVGLSHEQVVNIYTTYFESTKTGSNDFIGALGLGSKSPFSYTDNFTVTAIQDGIKGIYSAFINGEGVPSIAKMMEERTTDPNGVEIKFSVNDRWDFSKFRDEAAIVYQHFKLRPVVSGCNEFKIKEVEYKTRDIIPGVHETADRNSYAIMGNISYPISVPNAVTVLGELQILLGCGLVIEFEIGELDFQASREGLSYIPQTIESIKRKLTAISQQLDIRLAVEADKIQNLWERAEFLMDKSHSSLWNGSVKAYVKSTNFNLLDAMSTSWSRYSDIVLKVDELASKYNISMRSYHRAFSSGGRVVLQEQKLKLETTTTINPIDGSTGMTAAHYHIIHAKPKTVFVVSDSKTGAIARTRHHYRSSGKTLGDHPDQIIHLLLPADPSLPMNTAQFLLDISSPPTVVKTSELIEKPRKSRESERNATIMKLQRKDAGNYYSRSDGNKLVWKNAGSLSDMNDSEVYYYVELSGFKMISEFKHGWDTQTLAEYLKSSKIAELNDIEIYGVRKTDLEIIKQQPNWINLEKRVETVLKNMNDATIARLVKSTLDNHNLLRYNSTIINNITDNSSKYKTLVEQYKDTVTLEYTGSLKELLSRYAPKVESKIALARENLTEQCEVIFKRYSMLSMIDYYRSVNNDTALKIAEYINLVDATNE